MNRLGIASREAKGMVEKGSFPDSLTSKRQTWCQVHEPGSRKHHFKGWCGDGCKATIVYWLIPHAFQPSFFLITSRFLLGFQRFSRKKDPWKEWGRYPQKSSFGEPPWNQALCHCFGPSSLQGDHSQADKPTDRGSGTGLL